MTTKKAALLFASTGVLWMTACQGPEPHGVAGARGNPETVAGKAGKLAYKVEKETERAAKEADKKINQAARDAHAGYKDAEKERRQ